jgi:hypothetical protein
MKSLLVVLLLLPMAAWSQRECGITCSKDGECIDWLTVCTYPKAPLGMAWMTTEDDWKLITFPDERLHPQPEQVTTMIELNVTKTIPLAGMAQQAQPHIESYVVYNVSNDNEPADTCLRLFQFNSKTDRCETNLFVTTIVNDLSCTPPVSGHWKCSYIPKMLDTTPEEVTEYIHDSLALCDPENWDGPYVNLRVSLMGAGDSPYCE